MQSIYDETLSIMQIGYNCAETVMLMAGRYYLPEIGFSYSNLVTGFGGGMGRSREEACGALTGSVTALNMLVGRDDPSKSVDGIHPVIADFREIFIKEFDTTICNKLREGYEGEEATDMCQKLTAKTVTMLFDYLEEININRKI
ncbi:C_GCAxxG_C_C family protein [Denitrovibrio acetiphilus DSM 12809]|uniref:C_GCAxxG_C_C family protein n=1 Tax=Denitrovibrio acetiphilus (strain DSM 12809 / NBRC 114555 / N2460) TaxID=522772 RepID=D4H0L0_DENA2|nr:C-GCAxxG-C-C family protein [Denitrovibrio acetiphilus]ADD68523.1 C_GCAxxG_C_C family protein [Denitrovibrio acetiphilus DSM 12809]